MAQNKKITILRPLTTTTTVNILNPPATASSGTPASTAGQFFLVKRVKANNRTAGAINVALWRGATSANATDTECVWAGAASAGALTVGTGATVPANGSLVDFPPDLRLDVADFLVGGASAAGVTLEFELEVGVAG